LDIETHKTLNERIAQEVILPSGFSLDKYLKDELFQNGLEEILKSQTGSRKLWEWLRDGGEYEDLPTWYEPYLRSVNHFHDPLKSVDQAGFTGIWGSRFLHGKSAVLWSQSAEKKQNPGGYYS
jgi:hypothetical protein